MNFALEVSGLSKSFGDLPANADVNFQVRRGTIHAIIGENGAGKSTCMKMIYGLYRPDSGRISVFGRELPLGSPREAVAAGIGMVHQHFMLAGPYTALDNVIVTEANHSPFAWIARDRVRKKLAELSNETGFDVPWDAPVESLPVGTQQRIEILKLLYHRAEILVLDEPTAVLNPQETREFFARLRKMVKDMGKTVILITHKLKEVISVSDHVTILRGGRVVGDVETAKTSVEELAALMVGRKVRLSDGQSYSREPSPARPELGPVLELKGVSLGSRLQNLDFSVYPGEIVGIAGVDGNGQSDLLKLLLYPHRYARPGGRIQLNPARGEIRLMGQLIYSGDKAWGISAGKVRKLGVGSIPEDRIREGMLPSFDLVENFVLGQHRAKRYQRKFGPLRFLRWKMIREDAKREIQNYDVRPPQLDAKMGKLSGGNQQKLIVARELHGDPRFLLVAQPTRGVDVGAIEAIHAKLMEERKRGKGILLISSELDEVMALADRILVFYRGQVVGEFARKDATEEKIGLKMAQGGAAV